MRNYQISKLCSLASQKGHAMRAPDRYDEADKLYRRYRLHLMAYKLDEKLRETFLGKAAIVLLTLAIFAPFVLAI